MAICGRGLVRAETAKSEVGSPLWILTTIRFETGLTEQERKAISERVLFEVQLRKELESDNLNRRQRLRKWLESNLALLVVGSLISSLLVPYFQQKQEVIRWQKQNQYDNLKYKLERMRSALEECLTLAAYAAAIAPAFRHYGR